MNTSVLIWLLLTPFFWFAVLRSWRKGLKYMLLFIPFSGAVTLSLYPSIIPTLFSDIFFVIPLYIVYFIYLLQARAVSNVPTGFVLLIVALFVLAVVQMFNPNLENLLVALIGLKVWFFYVPLVFVTSSAITSRWELVSLFRFMVVVGWIPCIFGILTWFVSVNFGHAMTMEAIYGPATMAATQNLVTFMDGGLFRIPSTFTFVAQYFGFTLAMIVPAYSLIFLEESKKWKRFSVYSLVLFSTACLMSGSRGAFIFLPLLLIITLSLNGKFLSIVKILLVVPFIAPILLFYMGIDPLALFNNLLELLTHYGSKIVYEGFVDSLANAPLGLGTGMNTGASRYAFDDPLRFNAFENYYARSIYEFGFLGLILLLGLFSYIISKGFKILYGVKDHGLKGCAAAIVAFVITMCLHSLKGWQLDLVPINTYYWIFLGSLFSIGSKNFIKHS